MSYPVTIVCDTSLPDPEIPEIEDLEDFRDFVMGDIQRLINGKATAVTYIMGNEVAAHIRLDRDTCKGQIDFILIPECMKS